ncbi:MULTISPECIES: gluconate 2-dehydrogenase subunit 3 family protein [Bartonella]|uniref:gluconate 2-dehydrogenase subunit 3 family protein n=1 Tax=Bartonella TaxID=773 RepID=UPI0018DCCE89|nr:MULTISPECIES: gluconate 2-dehydrogenase subunit 3 family protein [Bartonella]MBH9974456.1 gluconate 2-dehydrogenase subunit 3 family protein [Bartonella choladocola]MBI0014063.1 gluconate 2-dehydrogenase subunit 3 family protein [Bartonella sp. B10834G3]MBI0139895.1 gluconate 2-dehydrogenase subunit 3 family protein [Bartonella choladocola]
MRRREFITMLTGFMVAGTFVQKGCATIINSTMPWKADATPTSFYPVIDEHKLVFFTQSEADVMGAIADCFIPSDELGIGGKEAGCVTFIDNQLAGAFGKGTKQYLVGPFLKGTPEQGPQYSFSPAERYKIGLAALDTYCKNTDGKSFDKLSNERQIAILEAMEEGTLPLPDNVHPKALFELMLQNVREGYLSDPIYGGNKGMASWKMLGFPGARYDFRFAMDRKGENLGIEPISLVMRSNHKQGI